MEKVNRRSFFPPLAIPEAYKRRRINTALSKEGQTVKHELENNQIMNQFVRQSISKESESIGKVFTSRDQKYEEFCVACTQRRSLQVSARPTSRARKDNGAISKEKIKGCICILCNKALPLSPQAAGHHKIIVRNNNTAWKEANQDIVLVGEERTDINREFQITPFDYDSRIEDMQRRMEDNEHYMPPKEVMRRSERKCQLWLLRNEEHIRIGTSSKYKSL